MAIVFGSEEAKKIAQETKAAEKFAILDGVDWDKVDVESGANYWATATFTFHGKQYRAESDDEYSEDAAVDEAIDDIKAQIKDDIEHGLIGDEEDSKKLPPSHNQLSILDLADLVALK